MHHFLIHTAVGLPTAVLRRRVSWLPGPDDSSSDSHWYWNRERSWRYSDSSPSRFRIISENVNKSLFIHVRSGNAGKTAAGHGHSPGQFQHIFSVYVHF